MSFLQPSPAEQRRTKLIVGSLALLATTLIMTGFLVESRWGYSKREPVIVYFQSWRGDRGPEQVAADRATTEAARVERLAEARRVIAAMPPAQRKKAQEQYDAYVKAGKIAEDIPYVPAPSSGSAR
jgi:hypothetical protein